MEIEAPYLQAIQKIAGKTPGEKQKTINNIARQIAQAESSSSHSVDSETPISDVPEPLKPLIRVEVAKILHQYDVIIEALKSEDMIVVNRALQANWFFDGSDTRLVNAEYFLENVFPEISLFARLRIVKHLGTYLKNATVAADFFTVLTQQYGVGQAVPLLVVCDEDFASRMINDNKIVLSLRMAESLYRKYPNLIIKYLMLIKPDDDDVRDIHRVHIRDYEYLLPEIANNHFEDFMKIYSMHKGLYVKLGKRATKIFFKTKRNLLVEEPDQYLQLTSLKTATQKLSNGEFTRMFKKLFPPEKDVFRYSTLNGYLQYYKPEEEKLPLILNTFREVYSRDLLSCKSLIDSDLMKVLPADDRVKEARLKLEDDKDWHINDVESSWRCYLPTCESIPIITKEIAETSNVNRRRLLLEQLVYTSKVNEDKDALLKVLNYIYDRHRNEQNYILYGCLSRIYYTFDLLTLTSNHWEILNKYVKLAEMKDDFDTEGYTMSQIIGAALYYCSLNDLPFDDYIRMFNNIKVKMYSGYWNISEEHPDLERKFLDLCIEAIPKQYPSDHKIWKLKGGDIIPNIASSLWCFNKRQKVSTGKLKKLFIKDYPWLLEKIKGHFLGEIDQNDWAKRMFLRHIKENDRESYYVVIQDLKQFWAFDTEVIFDVLKKHPQRVLDNWEECLEKIRPDRFLSSFITKCRWYQQLPIKFFEESMKTYKDSETCAGSMATLALLTDGETFTKIIEPFVPSDEKLDAEHPEAKKTYTMLNAIATNFHSVNPPVSLDVIASFCVGDYLQMAIRSLTSVCRRLPVSKVIPFATTLTNRRVSVMKHGIRLTYLVAPLEKVYTQLTDLWDSQGHMSVRQVVFTKIHDLFCKKPDSRGWLMIRKCLDNLNNNDDKEIFKKLTRLSTVPNEYLYEYISLILNAMKAMELTSNDPKIYIDISCQLIKNIDGLVTQILPEEYCQDLIKNYLFVFDYNSDIFDVGMNLTIVSYLLSPKKYDESRFKFFGNFFRHSVEEYWDKSHPKCSKFYPINFMIRKFFAKVCKKTTDKHDVRIFEAFLEIFQSALQPCQDAISYLDLVYSIAYHKSQTLVDFGNSIAEKIPELIEVFSSECIISMSNRLANFVKGRTFPESEDNEEKLLIIIEVFMNKKTTHCAFFAANMLFDNTSKKLNERHTNVVNALRNFHHSGVSWFLNASLATFDFCADNND